MLGQKHEVRKILGYLPQEFGVYPRTSAVELLTHFAALKGIPASQRREVVDGLLSRVNLFQHRRKSVASYSGGMRQRFGIAQALLGNPQLLIVDEPTAGLDPGERNQFYNLLAEVGENVIVILSTHIVQDVKELCTNMAIIDQGKLLYSGTPDEAEKKLAGRVWQKSVTKIDLPTFERQFRIISTKLVAGRPQRSGLCNPQHAAVRSDRLCHLSTHSQHAVCIHRNAAVRDRNHHFLCGSVDVA